MSVRNPQISVIDKGSQPGMVTLMVPVPCHIINDSHVAMFFYDQYRHEQTAQSVWDLFKRFDFTPEALEDFKEELEEIAGLGRNRLR